MDVYLSLGLATASALAINGLKVNKALKLLAVTGAVFAIGWNGGEATAGADSSDKSLLSVDPSAFVQELKRRVAEKATSTGSARQQEAPTFVTSENASQLSSHEAINSDEADEIGLAQLPDDRGAANP